MSIALIENNIGIKATTQKGVQLLTKGVFTRSALIEEAFVIGMIKFVHGEKWC